MLIKSLIVSFFINSVAFAQTAAPAAPSFTVRLVQMAPMFVMVFVIFYMLVLGPQNKKTKEQTALLSNLKNGQQVVTNSGIIARVAGIEKDYILLEIASNVKIKVLKEQIDKLFESNKESN